MMSKDKATTETVEKAPRPSTYTVACPSLFEAGETYARGEGVELTTTRAKSLGDKVEKSAD